MQARDLPVLAAGILFLAACQPTGGPRLSDAMSAPGVNARAEGEDALVVGHRLMDAGEYDLALKAYMRAAGEVGLNADVLSSIGSANLRLGRLGQAERILRQAIAEDPTSVPALNNLGVVLMERGNPGEARRIFQQAYALDSGATDSIRENLRLAIAQSESSVYAPSSEEQPNFTLVRRGQGRFVLLPQL